MVEKSRLLLLSSICSLVCGGVIIGLAVWNAEEVAWSPLTNAIAVSGGIIAGISLLGIITAQGCTFCCHSALYLYVWLNGALSLAGIGFVIAVAIKRSEWVEKLARKYADDESQENIDHLENKYEEFMPYVIAFGCVTVGSCVLGFLAAWRFLSNLRRVNQVKSNVVNDRVGRNTRESKQREREQDKARQKYHDTIIQMSEKYKLRKDPEGKLLK